MQRWVWLLAAGFIAIISVLALRGVVFRSVSRVRIAEYLVSTKMPRNGTTR